MNSNQFNFSLPKWTESVFGPGTDFEWASNRHIRTHSLTPELFRYTYGYLIREIFDHCAAKINGTLLPNRTMFVYSAHDKTIANILNIFSLFALFGYHVPPHASSLHFDLYKTIDNQFYLQLMYKRNDKPMLLRMPRCGIRCSIDELRQMYHEIIPVGDFEEECQLPFYIKIVAIYNIYGPDNGKGKIHKSNGIFYSNVCIYIFHQRLGLQIGLSIAVIAPIIFIFLWIYFSSKSRRNAQNLHRNMEITKA